MKKMCNKICRIFVGIGALLFSICNNVNALTPSEYGVENYEIKEPTIWEKMVDFIVKNPIIILITTLIGLFVFWKKSKMNPNKKMYITIGIMVIMTIIIFICVKIIK